MVSEDRTLGEWYVGEFSESSLFEIGSIRKSFNCALIGLGLEQGTIELNVKAHSVWPELLELSGEEKDCAITLHHLASGVSGWLTSDPPECASSTTTRRLPQPSELWPGCVATPTMRLHRR